MVNMSGPPQHWIRSYRNTNIQGSPWPPTFCFQGSWCRPLSSSFFRLLSLLTIDMVHQRWCCSSQTHQHTHPCTDPCIDLGIQCANYHLCMMPCHWQSDPRLRWQLPVLASLTQSVKCQTSSFSNKPSLSKMPNKIGKSSLCVQNHFSGKWRTNLGDLGITKSVSVKLSPSSALWLNRTALLLACYQNGCHEFNSPAIAL